MGDTKIIELCSGYGGISKGLKRVIPDLRVVANVEIEAFACANLVAKMEKGYMDSAPIWTNIKTFDGLPFRDRVHGIVGGYPCTPFSAAGKRKGADDPRHLWPYILKIVRTIKPTWCFFENVEGHITLGLREVIADLEGAGYSTTWGIFSAAEVGAPHQRKRVFILANARGTESGRISDIERKKDIAIRKSSVTGELAHAESERTMREAGSGSGTVEGQERTLPRESNGASGGGELAHSRRIGQEVSQEQTTGIEQSCQWPSRPGEPQHEWEHKRTIEPGVGLSVNGDSSSVVQSTSRIDELRMIGNGCVPATVTKAWVTLIKRFE